MKREGVNDNNFVCTFFMPQIYPIPSDIIIKKLERYNVMKIFISGSTITDEKLPKDVVERLDEYIDRGDEFLIGDKGGISRCIKEYLYHKVYDAATVYVVGDGGNSCNKLWQEEYCPVGVYGTKHSYYIEADFAMAEEADIGIVIWDGESIALFVNMITLVFQGKPCDMYLISEDRWIEIKELEDLCRFTGICDEWEDGELEEILTRCGFSMEMKQYLIGEILEYDGDLVDVICYAPISLVDKRKMLWEFYEKRNMKLEVFNVLRHCGDKIHSFFNLKKVIRKIINPQIDNSVWADVWRAWCDIDCGIDVLRNDNNYVFYLYSEWYDTDVFIEKNRGHGMFDNIDDIISYIGNEEKEKESGEGWYRIETWKNVDGRLSLVYNFYAFKDEVCWFEKMSAYKDSSGNIFYRQDKQDRSYYNSVINKVAWGSPFKTGDVIRIDCRPFGPPFHAVILEDEYQWDSCFPNILFKVPNTEEWRIEPLKRGRFYRDAEMGVYYTPMSALYGVRLGADEELEEFSEKLVANPKVAKEVWNKWHNIRKKTMTIEDVRRVFEVI